MKLYKLENINTNQTKYFLRKTKLGTYLGVNTLSIALGLNGCIIEKRNGNRYTIKVVNENPLIDDVII